MTFRNVLKGPSPARSALFLCGIAAAFMMAACGANARPTHGFKVLHNFGSGGDGESPFAPLFAGTDGNFYGTTDGGGKGYGTVFMITPQGAESVLYMFSGGNDGYSPQGGLAEDSQGNFYGTTNSGGANEKGTIFKLSKRGRKTVLYSFAGGNDGSFPEATLITDSAGNIYGTATEGGSGGDGVVFEFSASGSSTVLHGFAGADGIYPLGKLLRDGAGNLYGTTYRGGSNDEGTVFEIATDGTESILYSFTGGNRGEYPWGGVIQDNNGNLYGTTTLGGAGGAGTVYRLTPAGSLQVLYGFGGRRDGARPECELVRDRKGNLYGTTTNGGHGNHGGAGIVFKLTPDGAKMTLHAFIGSDGAGPAGGLVQQSGSRTLYGVTSFGGDDENGTVFALNE